ncbi:EP1-like glycoprotein 4 [Camellia lanceoleosa]|uniref:EP1-like glycoprotein 4 n=1 Tax=Camellia lanceoleosa TaxID=1840588 RepID=A0ACC0GUN7_9ERIC|nr:EP1-like glycoprotein 4 [Camellia lanceoleosa]
MAGKQGKEREQKLEEENNVSTQKKNGFAIEIQIIGHPNNTVVWIANRDYPPVSSNSTIEFTRDGKLILNHTQQGTELDIVDFNVDSRAVSALMLNSGNFLLYENDSSVIWQSFDSPTNTILGNQTLSNQLVSSVLSSLDHSSGCYCLQMQHDGNLVAYPINSTDSNIDVYRASDTSDPFDDDGNFRLYSHRFVSNKPISIVSVEWSAFQDYC